MRLPTAIVPAALALVLTMGAAASHPPQPEPPLPNLTRELRAEQSLLARLYPAADRDDKLGVLGLVIHGREAHLGYGNTNNRADNYPVILDLDDGRAVTMDRDGRRLAIPERYDSRLSPFRMHTEGTIPFPMPGGVGYLDYDPLTSRTESYLFPDGEAPTTVRNSQVGHNRDAEMVGDGSSNSLLVTHNSGRPLWPSLSISSDGGLTWKPATNRGEYQGPVGYSRFASYRERLYGYAPGSGVDYSYPAVYTVEAAPGGRGVVRALWASEADYWPANSSTTILWYGERIVMWPQVKEGFETDEGLYLQTTKGLYFTAAPEHQRPTAMPVPGDGMGVYATWNGRLYAVTGGRLHEFQGGRWTAIGDLRPSFEVYLAAFSDAGDLVLTGTGRGDITIAYIPAADLFEALPALVP